MNQEQIDALAELAGECRHHWDDEHMLSVKDRKHTPNWKCKLCGMTCCNFGFLEELGDKGCCGYSDFDLPAVGDGQWQPTQENLLGICVKHKWAVKLAYGFFNPPHGPYYADVYQGDGVFRGIGETAEEALSEAILKAAGRWEE